jgi:hypothetical protein
VRRGITFLKSDFYAGRNALLLLETFHQKFDLQNVPGTSELLPAPVQQNFDLLSVAGICTTLPELLYRHFQNFPGDHCTLRAR